MTVSKKQTAGKEWCKDFAKGFAFVPSSLGLIASTTPAEFKELVRAFYFFPDKWNAFLNWLPLPAVLSANVVNATVFSIFLFNLITASMGTKYNISLPQFLWSTRETFRTRDWPEIILFGGFFVSISFTSISFVYSESSNFLKLFVFIAMIAPGIYYLRNYRKAMLASLGILTAMQLLYWGNFTPWIDYL